MCVISDEMAYREYLEGREESADTYLLYKWLYSRYP